ncbi:MAG TPA: chaperone modulator CbpM [Eoetvoesiella sp.]
MTIQITESVWLNTSDICSFEHLSEVSGLAKDDLLDLVETGVIEPSNKDPDNYFFHASCIVVARTARRLRDDFELDAQGVALAMSLLRRIDGLEAELASLRARLTAQPERRTHLG